MLRKFCNYLYIILSLHVFILVYTADYININKVPHAFEEYKIKFPCSDRSSKENISLDLSEKICTKEIPTVLLFVRHFQNPEGNGSTKYFVQFNVCCKGYKESPFDKNRCIPDCGTKCQNGFCIRPNECQCFPGFVLNLNGECVHTCPQSCLNGLCYSNGTCFCDEGFELSENKTFCKPLCTRVCGQNENCTAPEHCSCLNGFVMNSDLECVPECKRGCGKGQCIGPEFCSCPSPYEFRDGTCQSNCTQICTHGKCLKPNKCVCNPGYKYDHYTTTCLPICKKCVNGSCIAPGCCWCYESFVKHNRICKLKKLVGKS